MDLIAKQWSWADKRIWFTSDDSVAEQLQSLQSGEIEIIPLGCYVRTPGDIATAQNRCFTYVQQFDYEFYFYQQADLIITPFGNQMVKDWLFNPTADHIGLAASQNKLNIELYDNPNGGVLMRKGFTYHSTEDGWHVDNIISPYSYRHLPHPWQSMTLSEECRPMMDLGYLSTAAYKRKLISHAEIWPDKDWKFELLDLYETDIEQALFKTFDRVVRFEESRKEEIFIQPLSGQYYWLNEIANNFDDYNLVTHHFAQWCKRKNR